MNDKYTMSTGSMQFEPLTKDKLIEAIEMVKNLPPPNNKYIVIKPDGQMYCGTAQELLPLLIQDHPLFNIDLAKPTFDFDKP